MPGLLIVEDNEDVRRQLGWGLSKEPFDVFLAATVDEALAVQREHRPEVVTLDLGLPPEPEGVTEGFRCLDALLEQDPLAQIIVVTGHHDVQNALRAVQAGAYDFSRKPVNLAELKVIIRRAFFLRGLRGVQREAPTGDGQCCGIVARCRAMRAVFTTIEKVAASDAPVLITGESGTGKELVARAIHNLSRRNKMSLVVVNCGAIPDNLLEAEFFGYEKGAFTGATQRVQGKVEYADKGTLFLDEIGELPINLQVKTLRFLQEMVIQRVGGRSDIPVNARIVAATSRDIAEGIRTGSFREDLYYRIGVVTIALPALRQREDDVLLLAEHFLARFASEQGARYVGFAPAAEAAMRRYPWPGNVRELENKVRRAVIFSTGKRIMPVDLGLDATASADPPPRRYDGTLKEARNALEREMVLAALGKHAGNIVQASLSIGVSRPTFYDLLKKHGIET
ncbi:PEP-CTERM-box response regulator transcription factor [Nitratidesulfovibrio sp.]|uniref:PEP-CTERM-box response regulator transcription factor n=1 Tax=Nitratidesulfovibrio sp. TaxID=2802297 RepID=UPI003341C5ED